MSDNFLSSLQQTINDNPSGFAPMVEKSDSMTADPVSSPPSDLANSAGDSAVMNQVFNTQSVDNTGEPIKNTEPTSTTPNVNWEEMTNGKYKSWDELAPIVEEYEKLKSAPQESFAHESVKKFNDYVAKGGKVDKEWMKKAFMDYDAIENPYEILSEKFSLEGLSPDEIEYKLVSEYGSEMDPEGDSLEERAMRAKVKREVDKARAELKKYQDEVVWTAEGDDKLSKFLSEQQAQQEAYLAQVKQINEKLDKEIQSVKLNKIPISVTDKDANLNINVEFDAGDTKDVMTYVSELTKNTGQAVYDRYKKEDGTFDLVRMATDEYKLRNFDEILRKVAVNAYSKGAKNEVMGIKNITALHREEPINVTDLKARQEQAVLNIIKGL
jgi:hypothetical protein